MPIFKALANGFWCIGPFQFVSSAFILSQFAQKGCEFLKFDVGDDADRLDGAMAYAGLTCYRAMNGVERMYADNYNYGPEHDLARKMALSTLIMGATSWGFYWLASCIRFHAVIWVIISLTLAATCVCEGMMFKFFDADICDDGGCSLGTSSKCGISACVFWGVSSLMTCAVAKEAMDRGKGERDEEELCEDNEVEIPPENEVK